MKPIIAVWFEYPTLNGGERSMLAILERIETVKPLAIAPPLGPLSEALRARGIEQLPLEIHAQGSKQSRDEIAARLITRLQAHRPALVHANSLSLSRLAGALRSQFPCPVTGHLRDIMKLSRVAIVDLNRVDRLIAVSHATRNAFLEQGLVDGHCQVIANGIDLDAFSPQAAMGTLHRELGLDPAALLIGTIGQICLRKGQDLLPEVAARLPTRERQIHFVLIGTRHSRKAETRTFDEAITARFGELGLSAHLHRLGQRDDIPKLLGELTVLFHPARQEPLGRVLLESAARGCPIVATDVGGTSEIVEHEQSALLFKPGDGETAARQLLAVFDDRTLRERLVAFARATVSATFPIDAVVKRTELFWRRLLDGH